MRKILKIVLCMLLAFLLIPTLCSCSRQLISSADELTTNKWISKLDNGNVIELSFAEDNATLKLCTKGSEAVIITGFCEVSDSELVIHDSTFGIYPFSYIVHFDSVELTYNTNTVSLNKLL